MNTNRKFLPNDDDSNQAPRNFRLLPRYSELVARARSGDREALGALHDEHAEDVRAFVSERVADEHLQEDACQDVWVAVIEEIASFEGASDQFQTWLLAIAERTCPEDF